MGQTAAGELWKIWRRCKTASKVHILDRLTAVIQNTSAQERLLVRGAAAEVSSRESTEDLVEARWRTEVFGSAAPLPAEPSMEGASTEATGEKEKPSDVIRQQAKDRFKQIPGPSHAGADRP